MSIFFILSIASMARFAFCGSQIRLSGVFTNFNCTGALALGPRGTPARESFAKDRYVYAPLVLERPQ